MTTTTRSFTAPVFLGTAFLVFGVALIEKMLNLVGTSLPFVGVFPRQLLDWAVTLLMFEIALTLRQLVELKLGDRRDTEVADPLRHPH